MLDPNSPEISDSIRKLLPKTFIAPADFGVMNPVFVRPLKGRIMVHTGRIVVPNFVWKQVGSPPGAAIFMDRWDLFIAPGRMETHQHKHYVGIHLPGTEFANLVKTGEYWPEQYETVTIGGIKLLKIKACNQFCVDMGSLQHWKAARDALAG